MMEPHPTSIQPLLASVARARVEADHHDVCLSKASRHVVKALQDDEHGFHERIARLRDTIHAQSLEPVAWLLPRFNSGTPAVRELAPTQFLLLLVAMKNPGGQPTLEDVLGLGAARVAESREQALKALGPVFRTRWLDHIEFSLPLVDNVRESVSGFQIEGRRLRYGDVEEPVRLSKQEALMMSALLETPGSSVSSQTLREAGVNNPSDRKLGLVKKLNAADMPSQRIQSVDGGYVLMTNG